eukprot:Rhum_TRINITY_DN16459_c0_g1::Rhum_TRINITY_DN16459_c0_g1_i1::g.163247::m.163247
MSVCRILFTHLAFAFAFAFAHCHKEIWNVRIAFAGHALGALQLGENKVGKLLRGHRLRRLTGQEKVAGPQTGVEGLVDGLLDLVGLLRHVELQAEHHRHRQDHRRRVAHALSRDVRRRAVDRLVHARGAVLAQGGRGQQTERTAQHRRLVGENVAEQVLRDDDVHACRALDQVHRARVDQLVRQLDVGELVLHRLRGHAAPQARRRQHVRLVDGEQLAGPLAGRQRRDADDALHLRHGVGQRVEGRARRILLAPLAEVQAARQLAHHEQVDALHDLGTQRARVQQRVEQLHRTQVGEQVELLADLQETLLGAALRRLARVPLRSADGAEDDGVARSALVERLVGEGVAAGGVDGGAADEALGELELAHSLEHAHSVLRHLGADAVTRQQRDLRHGGGAAAADTRPAGGDTCGVHHCNRGPCNVNEVQIL